jgi:hypothetical protein
MGRSFGSASDLFRSTISKMGALVSGGGGSKHMYLLIVFVVLVFMLLYFLISRKS